ncbi:hypothetical protein DV737_g2391, partial [Chaetothyriales sp. CBS 132003]
MSSSGSSSKCPEEPQKTTPSAKSASKRASSRGNKKNVPDTSPSTQTQTPPARRQKKRLAKKEADVHVKSDEDAKPKGGRRGGNSTPPVAQHETSDSMDDTSPGGRDDDASDPFSAALFGSHRGGPGSSLSSTLRTLSGMMSGMSARLREILSNLRQSDNPTMQLVALEELSNLLLVSNEDNLSGQFSPDPYVKELVALMQPNPLTGEENPEMMLLACRCIANLMEALRGAVANVVYGGAVPVLCQKLLDIQYIDVAEQALSTLSKVSIDYPGSIVREGGLTACLQFLDFFATGTQRTAVTTAANCCRNIPHDSFPVIRDVMPILQNVLASHDQKVVEQGCLCVTRVIDSFKHSPDKLEQLVDPALLRAVLGLLLPGTTNLIGANIHTEFLRVLAIVARASPRLSADLLKMNVVDTLYQILTGVSPPRETADAASNIDSVVIMQALIHRPREQVFETLNVICELLPQPNVDMALEQDIYDESMSDDSDPVLKATTKAETRIELLKNCKQETRRFAVILLPTLTDAYSSTVNLSVRQKVLTAQLKILSNLETAVIEEALRPVPYASFLASILSQEDHPSLVMFALQASELLLDRLEEVYQYQFHREGVIGQIQKIASRPTELDPKLLDSQSSHPASPSSRPDPRHDGSVGSTHRDALDEKPDDDAEHDDDLVVQDDDVDEDQSSDSSAGEIPPPIAIAGVNDLIVLRAQSLLHKCDTARGRELKEEATRIRADLQHLATEIETCYSATGHSLLGAKLFERLVKYFDGDALEGITSSELRDSGIIRVLVAVLAPDPGHASSLHGNPRRDFLVAMVGTANHSKIKPGGTLSGGGASTALSVLIRKLQDLLSRAEHFEVLTVNNNASESSRGGSASMLSRQLRLRLSAAPDSDIPAAYREMIVSIHAIATFKALDDYLRPRFSLSDRPISSSRRHEMLQQIAQARMAHMTGAAESGLFTPFGQELGSSAPSLPPAKSSSSRSVSRSKAPKDTATHSDPPPATEKTQRRRSARRAQPSSTPPDPRRAPPEPSTEDVEPRLEIADEKQLPDDAGAAADDRHALDTFVDGLEEEMSDDGLLEPAAVNMEVGSSGKVTARQEDGTRIQTPQPGTPASSLARPDLSGDSPSLALPNRTLPTAGRPSSYSAALASIPQDWHIEFSIDGRVIPNYTTIYRAVQHNREQAGDAVVHRSVWSGVHTIKFKKVAGPPPPSSASLSDPADERELDEGEMPTSLDGHPITSSILSLLRILHELNSCPEDVCETLGRPGLKLHTEPLASFINTKLTAKMNRQLEEPLIVASNCLPDWAEDLARAFPFLFPFETRHLFLQSTSFGYSRSMIRWQSNQADNDDRRDRRRDDRPLLGRPQRQKVRISRHRILESAMKVMEMYGASPSVLEVEYFEEVGTGLGPTLEFYSAVSKEFSKKKLDMWRSHDSSAKSEFAFGKNGLFPAPMSPAEAKSEGATKISALFRMLGMFVARSMLDSRIIDLSFNPTFFKLAEKNSTTPSIALLRTIDQDLAKSMAQLQKYAKARADIERDPLLSPAKRARAMQDLSINGATIEDLSLDFTLPGYPHIDLIDQGSQVEVTMDNLDLYIDRVLDLSLGSGVGRQIDAFKAGFSQVFSYTSLKAFTSNELVMLFGRADEDWSIETLMDSVKADHGFNMDSKSVKHLLQTMSELSMEERRDFLQFVTGSPKLPIGGFKSLTPMFTVVCKPSEPPYTSDDYLPSVMTCVNYLKLPDYSSQGILKERLRVAIKEGQVAGPDSGPEPPFPIKLSGPVIKGFGRGSRELGIPTANIPPTGLADHPDLTTGVYFGFVGLHLAPHTVQSADNSKLTLSSPSSEIHILHHFPHYNFYYSPLNLLILGFIRPEYDYESLDALVSDIKTDCHVARRSLERPNWKKWRQDDWLRAFGWVDELRQAGGGLVDVKKLEAETIT